MASNEESSQGLPGYNDVVASNETTWTAETFKDVEEAQTALNNARAAFLQWEGVSKLLPQNVRVHLNNVTGDGQIRGFDELFVYLARSAAAGELRKKVLEFFSATPEIREHLKPK